jgi:hypothetical protein
VVWDEWRDERLNGKTFPVHKRSYITEKKIIFVVTPNSMKTKLSVILLFAFIIIAGCKKDVHLIIPTILTSPSQPATLDTVTERLIASAVVENESFKPDSCQWQILDDANQKVAILPKVSDTVIRWVPKHAGDYRIIAKAFYDNNNTVTVNAQVYVQNKPSSSQNLMVGKWQGIVTTPWVAPYKVKMEFFNNGQYSAKNIDSVIKLPALYYGTDKDSTIKTYEVISLDARGANGRIVVLFEQGTKTIDDLKAINLSNNNDSLKFELWHSGIYGPVKYRLGRQ